MATQVTVSELQSRLEEYLCVVKGGESLVIVDDQRQIAQIVPAARQEHGSHSVPANPNHPLAGWRLIPADLASDEEVWQIIQETRGNTGTDEP